MDSPNSPQKNEAEITVTASQVIHEGPLPDPLTLQQYNQIEPGFANRLLVMAETEQLERIKIQNKVLDIESNSLNKELDNIKRGQFFALISVFGVLTLCGIAFFLDHPGAASSIGIAVIVGLAAVFLGAKHILKKQSKEKAESTEE